jgi:hypothetical protein
MSHLSTPQAFPPASFRTTRYRHYRCSRRVLRSSLCRDLRTFPQTLVPSIHVEPYPPPLLPALMYFTGQLFRGCVISGGVASSGRMGGRRGHVARQSARAWGKQGDGYLGR